LTPSPRALEDDQEQGHQQRQDQHHATHAARLARALALARFLGLVARHVVSVLLPTGSGTVVGGLPIAAEAGLPSRARPDDRFAASGARWVAGATDARRRPMAEAGVAPFVARRRGGT
jgi:hypothetical protein